MNRQHGRIMLFCLPIILLLGCTNRVDRSSSVSSMAGSCAIERCQKIAAKLRICEIPSAETQQQLDTLTNAMFTDVDYCDPYYLTSYGTGPRGSCADGFILEKRNNRGAGEYRNFLISKVNNEFQIILTFRGYIDDVSIEPNGSVKVVSVYWISTNCRCIITGLIESNGIRTLSVEPTCKECSAAFPAGSMWIDEQ